MGPSINNTHTSLIDLVISGIHKSFGQTIVLRDMSLTVSNGELCCLLGPSGCGKSTILRIIDGLIEIDRGTIKLAGKDITDLPPQKRNIGLVFQNYALFPFMSVFDNIAYGLRRRKYSKSEINAKVKKALETVRLTGYENRRIHEISGGQQQRVALARSLVIEPALLLLDEPLSNLDARLRAEMRGEIKRIQKEFKITTLYVTHDQEEAMAIADRIVVMNNGMIEQIGTPHEIYENPASEFVASFIGDINMLQGVVNDDGLLVMNTFFDINTNHIPQGTKVTCAVRPERIQLIPESKLPVGKIREAVYFGSTVRYHVIVENLDMFQELLVEVPVSRAEFVVGNNISINVQKEFLRIFPGKNNEAL
jgi:iron(III) transport system ATP-binding protein